MEVQKKLFRSGRFLVVLLVLLVMTLGYHSGIFEKIAEAVEVTLDANVAINGTSHLQAGSQTVFINDQTGYKFFRDSAGYCVYRKSTDGGVTWSSTTTVDAQTDCIAIQVWYDKWTPGSASSSIHIATLESGTSETLYNRLDPGPDTLLKGSAPATTSLLQGGTIVEGANTITITRATDGTIYMGSIDDSDSFVMRCTGSCNATTSWTEAGATNSPFMLSNNYGILLPLTNGNILAIQRDITAENMTSKVWNNGAGTWDAASTTFDFSATDNTTYDVGMAAMVSSTTPGNVYLAYIASSTVLGTDDVIRSKRYSGGAWSTTTDILSGTTRGITNVALGIDAGSDNVYVAYSAQTTAGTAATGNVLWKWATSSMMNWSQEAGPINSAANDIYGVDINGISDERIYASWFINTGDAIRGDTLADVTPGIIASSTGTSTQFAAASTTNNYFGGAFVLTENYKTHDVTGITITESGTIDASLYINNIKLKYEMDTTFPYNCNSVSYNGTETQFGSTDTDGFSGPNGTSAFSGTTVTVSTTSAMCIYPVMDLVFSSAQPATTTLKLSINDARTDIIVTGSTAAPGTSQYMVGSTTVYTVAPTQVYYHWRHDNGTELTSNSATGFENTPLTNVAQTLQYRLRLEVSNRGGTTTGPYQYRLEYGRKVSTCAAVGTWTDVATSLGDWDMGTTSPLTEAADTTNIATTTGGVTDDDTTFLTPNGGQRDQTSQTGNITLTTAQYVEFEYALEATASSTEGATYCFRVTNAGTAIPVYSVYPEATVKYPTDFKVQRGVMTITGTSLTLTAGVDYVAPLASTSAFIRITNTHYTGAGDTAATANQNSDTVTAYIQNPSNIMNSVTFARTGTSIDTRVAWEIVEYTGVAGGENEIKVRSQTAITYGATAFSATTSAVAGIVDDTDVVVFITGQFNPDIGRTEYNSGLSTSQWNAAADTASFWRGEGTGAVIASYAVVEFTGSNWAVRRTNDHQYAAVGVTETENITAVGSITRAFLHTQKRVGLNLNTHANFGHEVVLSGINQVSFRLDPAATSPTQHFSVAWVIENTQTVGDFMVVSRSNATSSGGVAPLTTIVNHGVTVDDLSVTSLFINNRASGALTTFPEPMIAARMITNSQYELWMSNTGGNRVFFTEVVEWPTARRKITQNYYRLFASSTALKPTDPWSTGGTINLGENTEMTGLDDPIGTGQSVRIRMSLNITAASMIPGVDSFKLQYASRPTPSCTAISSTAWSDIGNIGSTTALWRATSTPLVDGTVLSTDPYTPGDLILSVSDVAGTFEEENNTAVTPYQVDPSEDVEYDWAIEDNSAADKTSYCFRMVESNGTLLTGYNFYPTVRTVGYGAQSQDWQWYDDAENLNPTTTLAATNTAPIDIDYDNAIKLELTLREVNGASKNNAKFRLQFSEFANFSTSTFVAASSSCTNLSYWCYTDGGGTDNATITAKRMGDADACVAGVGNGCGTYNEFATTTSTFTHKANAATEFSFTIRSSGARVNRVYYFRAYDAANDEDVPLGSGEVYPSLVTKGSSLVFTMSGIATSTSVEGVVTDFATTPVRIPFGSLVASTSVEGVQRLTIDTNGTQGHRILMMLTSDMRTSNGAVMTNVTGTNAVPTAWSIGCVSTATSCFGYHAGDDTLQGDSTRFSANDTYAGFSTTTPEEVSYVSQPVIGDTTDIVFKLMTRNLQSAGQYTASVMYLSIPMF